MYKRLATMSVYRLLLIAILFCVNILVMSNLKKSVTTNPDAFAPGMTPPKTANQYATMIASWLSEDECDSQIKFENCDVKKWVENYRDFLIKTDYIFPVLYALFFASIIARGTYVPGQKPSTCVLVFFVFPFITAIFDFIENTLNIWVLAGVSTIADVLVLPAMTVELIYYTNLLKISFFVISALATLLLISKLASHWFKNIMNS